MVFNVSLAIGAASEKKQWMCIQRSSTLETSLLNKVCCRLNRGSSKQYFPVLTQTNADTEGIEIDFKKIVAEATRDINEPLVTEEDSRTMNLFYVQKGWYGNTELRLLTEEAVWEKFKCLEGFGEKVAVLKSVLVKLIGSLSSTSFHMRSALGDSEKRISFRSLTSAKSKSDYVSSFLKVFFFVINIVNSPMPQLLKITREIETATHAFVANVSEKTLLSLLNVLMSEIVHDPDDSKSFFVLLVKLWCLKPNRRLQSVENVGRFGSNIIYLLKLAIIGLSKDENGQVDWEKFDIYKKVMDPKEHYAGTSLILIVSFAQSINLKTKKLPNIVEIIPARLITIDGIRFELDSVRKVYLQCLECIQRIQKSLLLGLEVSIDTINLVDNHGCQERNYCYRHCTEDGNRLFNEAILMHVCKDDMLRNEFILSLRNNTIVWIAERVRKYVELYNAFIQKLICLIHIGSGMPARSCELETYKFVGGVSSSRTMFLNGDLIFFFVEYSKTNNLSMGSKNTVRFLDQFASPILIIDKLIIRPILRVISKVILQDAPHAYGVDIFVKNGIRMHVYQIRADFAKVFRSYSETSISFAQYRHIARHMANILLGLEINYDEDEEEEDEYLDLFAPQLGHSSTISNNKCHFFN